MIWKIWQMTDISFSFKAWQDYLYWQTHDKKMLKKINGLIKDIEPNQDTGIGKLEPFKGNFSGFYSRRIDYAHRIVYRVKNKIIEILSCKGHYEK